MKFFLLAVLLSAPAFAQAPQIPPIGALCLPTLATTHTMVNPSTGNTLVTMWCDLTPGLYHYAVSGNTLNWSQAQCLTTIEPFNVSTVWLQHAWGACVTSVMSPSDQAYAFRLLYMWVPRPTVLGASQPVFTLKADGSLGPQLSVAGVPQTIKGGTEIGGLRLASGTVSPRYCSVMGYKTEQGSSLPGNTYALCTLVYPPLGGFLFPSSSDGLSLQAPTDAFLVDSAHHVWGIDANGLITVDGIEDSSSANVSALFYVGGLMWQRNGAGLWWGKTSPSAPWLPAGGTATPPI